jgi:hypothetical protein
MMSHAGCLNRFGMFAFRAHTHNQFDVLVCLID